LLRSSLIVIMINVQSTESRYIRLHNENEEKIELINPRSMSSTSQKIQLATSIEHPGDMDVLCGRGRGYFEHPGNRRMLAIISEFKSEYQTAAKVGKSNVTQRVLQIVLGPHNGVRPRFLKRGGTCSKSTTRKGKNGSVDTAGASWQELCEKEVHKKVAHTLREQKSIVKLSKTAISETLRRAYAEDDDGRYYTTGQRRRRRRTTKTSTAPPETPEFLRLVSDDSFAHELRPELADLDLESIDNLFTAEATGRADEGGASSSANAPVFISSAEQQPLNFQQEPVFDEKEIDLLHTVLEEEVTNDGILHSFLEDLNLHNSSFRASFSKPTAVV
jgi:hypothetical protein